MIISDGAPRFTRDIFMGTADVARRMTSMAGLTLPQARAMCAGAGDITGHEEAVLKCVEAVLPNLVAEIRVSLDYFKTEKKVVIGRICLIGDGVCVPKLESVFGASFDIPLVVWNPAEGMLTAVDREGFLKEGRRSITALGLALGEYDQT
jgi:Tfp pilus assembly PilM family ATPase